MRICILYTYGVNYSEIAQICIPSLIKYGGKHGYDVKIKCVEKNANGWYGFINTKLVRELLDGYELLLSLEGDIMVTGHTWKIEDFIDDEHSFFICRDMNNFNAGSFIVKNTHGGKELLDFINSFESELGHEQNVLETHLQNDDRVKTLPHPTINSIPYELYKPSYGYIGWEKMNPPPTLATHEEGNWEKGDFVLHLPAMPIERRIEVMTNHLKDIVYE